MQFRHRRSEEPEINLIPFIDVLLVVLIFVMMSASFSKFNELELNLPSADGRVPEQRPHEILVSVNAQGGYSLQRQPLGRVDIKTLAEALATAGPGPGPGSSRGCSVHHSVTDAATLGLASPRPAPDRSSRIRPP